MRYGVPMACDVMATNLVTMSVYTGYILFHLANPDWLQGRLYTYVVGTFRLFQGLSQ